MIEVTLDGATFKIIKKEDLEKYKAMGYREVIPKIKPFKPQDKM